jgi:GTPase SAR1 family protein
VYYKEAVGAFVVFDVTRISTYEAVKKWKHDIDAKVTIPGTDDPIPVVLLANKIDLVPQEGEEKGWGKTPEEMDAFCKEHGFVTWFETSAKDNTNIESGSNALVKAILERENPLPPPPPTNNGRISIGPDKSSAGTSEGGGCPCSG